MPIRPAAGGSRFFSESLWLQSQVNNRRLGYLRQKTKSVRLPKAQSAVVGDDTLCEHVKSLFEYIDRHYNQGDNTYPFVHNPVTSHYVSGPVRFPIDLRLYRRYEEVTQWETLVHKHFLNQEIPKRKKERTPFHKRIDPVLQQDPSFRALEQNFHTELALACKLVEAAIEHQLPFGVVLFDSWYLAPEFIAVLRRRSHAPRKTWCLVFVAYSLLLLECLPSSLTQSRLPIKTIGEACRQQSQVLIEALILQMHERVASCVTITSVRPRACICRNKSVTYVHATLDSLVPRRM